MNVLIRIAQQSIFAEEIDCLKGSTLLHKRSRNRTINPFLDDQQILRVVVAYLNIY